MKALRIEIGTDVAKILGEVVIEPKLIDGIYVKAEGKGLIPVAYVYPLNKREELQAAIDELNAARKACREVESKILYRTLPAICIKFHRW